MQFAHRIHWKVAQHRAIDKQAMIAIDHWRQNAWQRNRRPQRAPQQTAAVGTNRARDKVGRNTEERNFEVFDQRLAEILLEPVVHALASD